jgi:hypothetical protein
MTDRDDKIIKHIGRYGVSIRAVIEKLFFEGSTCDHVLNRLIREGRIASKGGIPGGLCYYHLTISEARSRGVPDHRARGKKRSRALREALQVLWFCCMSDKKRNRIERRQMGASFETGKGSGKPHLAEIDGDRHIVYRVYTPGPNSRDNYLLKVIRADFEAASEMPTLKGWIEDAAFGFALLVETDERKERLKRLLRKGAPRKLSVTVEVVPGLSTLAVALKSLAETRATNAVSAS